MKRRRDSPQRRWLFAALLLLPRGGLLIVGSGSPALAQEGDREGHVMKEVWRQMEVPAAPPLSPEEALASLAVAPGFRVELVAAEPLVEDPVAIAWDPLGRLWAVEMRGFMPNVDGIGEQQPVGQVVVLEDLDRDGKMDKSTVFLDRLVLARALAVVADGALIGEPPNLWYCPDRDGDLVCDRKIRVGEYGDPHPDALEHTENGLLWALDNWIYNAKSDRRFRFAKERLVEERTHFRGQWGISQDDYGRLYYNTNSRYLLGDLFPSRYLTRNAAYLLPSGGRGIAERLVGDESVFTVRLNPGINRGYQGHMLREDGRLKITTSVSGLAIYRGHQFPDSYRGDVFIPEPAGNVVTLHRLEDSGVEIRSEHETYPDVRWGQREFLASTDERFRPVDCAVGPDGALYVVDMYRGILQHRHFVTTFLRKQILERGLERPLGLGRIYRVVYEGRPIDHSSPELETAEQRIAGLRHPNGWVRDTAQRLLVEAESPASVPGLRRLARSESEGELARIHALWSLHGLEALDGETVAAALSSEHPWLRIMALRVGGALAGKEGEDFLQRTIALSHDSHPGIRLQAAFSLGELGGSPRATERLLDLLLASPHDVYLRQAAISGLAGQELAAVRGLLDGGDRPGRDEALAELAAVVLRRAPARGETASVVEGGSAVEDLQELLALATEAAPGPRAHLVGGLLKAAGTPGFEPRRIAEPPALLSGGAVATERRDALERVLTWQRTEETDDAENAAGDSERAAFERRGRQLFRACDSCHGPNGEGQAGMGPPLVGSPLLLGPDEILVRLVLDGLEGRIVVDGEVWDDVMPGFRRDPRLDDGDIASLLSFLRSSWGHGARRVDEETVRRLRAETVSRESAWTVEQLEELRSLMSPQR